MNALVFIGACVKSIGNNLKRMTMKKVLQCLGVVIASPISGYLLWLFFYWVTPYVMGIGWGLFLLYVLFASGLLFGVVGVITTLLATPITAITTGNKVAKVIYVIPMLFFGFSSLRLPWEFDMDYGFLQILLAVSLSIIVLITFICLMAAPFAVEKNNKV